MKKQKGFSLIELLIVVAIILIIAAIAIPNLLRARMAANEASAVATVRTINTSEVMYVTAYPAVGGYSASLLVLGGAAAATCTPSSASACLIDSSLAAATASTNSKSGYYFDYAQITAPSATSVGYTLHANPVSANSTGVRYFYSDATGVIHANTTVAVGPADPSI